MRAITLLLLFTGCIAATPDDSSDVPDCTIAVTFPDGTSTEMECTDAAASADPDPTCDVARAMASPSECARVAYSAGDKTNGPYAAFQVGMEDLAANHIVFPTMFDAEGSSAGFFTSLTASPSFLCFSSAGEGSIVPGQGGTGTLTLTEGYHGTLHSELSCSSPIGSSTQNTPGGAITVSF